MLNLKELFNSNQNKWPSSELYRKILNFKWEGELLINIVAKKFKIQNAEKKISNWERKGIYKITSTSDRDFWDNLAKFVYVFFGSELLSISTEEANSLILGLFIEEILLEVEKQLNNGNSETLEKLLNYLKEIITWKKLSQSEEEKLSEKEYVLYQSKFSSVYFFHALTNRKPNWRKSVMIRIEDFIKNLEIKITSLQHQGNLLNTIIKSNTWKELKNVYNSITNETLFKNDSAYAKSVEREKINVLKKLINKTNNLPELETLKNSYSSKILTEYQNEVNTAYQKKKQQLTEDQGNSFLMAISQSQDWKTLKSAIKKAQDNLTSTDDQTKIKVSFISVLERIINSAKDKDKLESLKTNYQSDSYFQVLASSDQTKINNAYDAKKQQLETSILGNNNQGQDNNSNIMPWVIGISMSLLGICLVTVLYRFYRKRKIQK